MEPLLEFGFYVFVITVLAIAGWAYRLNKGAKRARRIAVLWSVYVTSTLFCFIRPIQRLLGFDPFPFPGLIIGVFAIVSVIVLLAIAAGEGGFVQNRKANLWHWRPWVTLGLGLAVICGELGLLWIFSWVQA